MLTQFIDWSATHYDVLYIMGNRNDASPVNWAVPSNNFNGITVAASAKVGDVYRRVADFNDYDYDADGDRTSIGLLAPGAGITVTSPGDDNDDVLDGTSLAAPHVSGTVALLQQYGDQRIGAGAPHWDTDARHHEVMKAVLMNSADKLIDDGTFEVNGMPVPRGGLLGMDRTVLKQDGESTWLDSYAYYDGADDGWGQSIPLDEEMGAGHLNAGRALAQFRNGEYEADGADVPVIGWDYGTTTGEDDVNRYRLDSQLLAETFISITLAWDREVTFSLDADSDGQYDVGDTFEEYVDDGLNPPDDSVINNLTVWLLPKFAANFTQYVAVSDSSVGTLQHIFFQIPETGEYEIWVEQHDEDVGTTQDYAIAWWAAGITSAVAGDYDGNGTVGEEDFLLWKANFNSTTQLAADGNGDGIVNVLDYIYWRNNLDGAIGAGGLAQTAVPEPATWLILAIGIVGMGSLRRRMA